MRHFLIALALTLLASEPVLAKASLRGSPQALAEQNRIADRENLSRLHSKDLASFKKKKLLVRIPTNKAVKVDKRLPAEYRFVRPWTRDFIVSLSRDYEHTFHKPLRINSGVRTVERQHQLIRINGNAARGTTPSRRSSHLTGATIDITKVGMSRAERSWMRTRLLQLERAGHVEATEERMQSVFHIMVCRPKHHTEKKTNKKRKHASLKQFWAVDKSTAFLFHHTQESKSVSFEIAPSRSIRI